MPKSLFSRLFGYIARIPLPQFIMRRITDWYCKKFSISLDDYEIPPEGFRRFDDFFTRKVKADARPVDSSPNAIVSPVDARVDQTGDIVQEALIQAKGVTYSLRDLLPSPQCEHFVNGSFVTLYLSPADYHRIHSPVNGSITGYFHIPGKLYTVQEFMARGLPGLFSVNERLISYISSPRGRIAVCKIGAMNVGRISLSYADEETNRLLRKKKEVFFGSEIPVKAGAEIGVFHLGSTVILLFEAGAKPDKIKIGDRVKAGQRIGSMGR